MFKRFSKFLPVAFCMLLSVSTFAQAGEAPPAAPPAAATPAVAEERPSVLSAFFVIKEKGEDGKQHFETFGCTLIWFLMVCSFVCTSLMLMFFLKARLQVVMPPENRDAIKQLLEQGKTDPRKYKEALELAEADPSYFGRLTYAALKDAPHGFSVMERSLEEAAAAQLARKIRPYEVLNIVGNVGPMLGLFGTVQGMIMSFFKLVSGGGNADPKELAAGISTALVATFWGMVVAIPALIAYAVLRNLTEHNCAEVLLEVDGLISQFRPSKKKADPAAAPAPAPARPASRPE